MVGSSSLEEQESRANSRCCHLDKKFKNLKKKFKKNRHFFHISDGYDFLENLMSCYIGAEYLER